MEKPNRIPFPKIEVLPSKREVKDKIIYGLMWGIHMLTRQIEHEPAKVSDHFSRGAAKELDAALYDQPTLFDNEDGNRWDDMGNYYEGPR